MRSESLDRRITVQRATPARDGLNNETLTWADLATLWASYRPASAREQLALQEVGADLDAVFQIRWSPLAATINPKDRVVFDGRVFDISEAVEIGRRDGIRIKAAARSD